MNKIYFMKCGHISSGTMFFEDEEVPVCISCRLSKKENDFKTIVHEIEVEKELWDRIKKHQIEDRDGLYSCDFVAELLNLSTESIRHYTKRYKIGKRLTGWYFSPADIVEIFSRMSIDKKKKVDIDRITEIGQEIGENPTK